MKFLSYCYIIMSILLSNTINAQWQKVFNPGSRILSIKEFGGRIYTGTEDNGAWLSKDSGESWSKLSISSLTGSYDVKDFESDGSSVWIGTRGGGVIYSHDGETNWQLFNTGFETQAYISKLILIGDTLFAAHSTDAGLMPSGVYKTSITNIDWKPSGYGFPGNIYSVSSMVLSKGNVFYVGNQHSGTKGNIFMSKDKGKNWSAKPVENMIDINCLFTSQDYLYAGTANGIYYTTDLDTVWNIYGTDLSGYYVDDIVNDNGKIFAAVDEIGIIHSNDNGDSWQNISYNLPLNNEFISNIKVIDGYIYAGLGSNNGLWRIPIDATQVDENENIRQEYQLFQNYPNPFNAQTTIQFKIAKSDYIELNIYDVQGNYVKNLYSGTLIAGKYQIKWDSSNNLGHNVASGVYFYQIKTKNYNYVRKMQLIK